MMFAKQTLVLFVILATVVSMILATPIASGSRQISRPLSLKRTDPCYNNGLPITLHNGVIMPYVNAYIIWYGNWAGSIGTTLIPSFLANVGSSPWYGVNNGYYGTDNRYVTQNVTYVSSYVDNYSLGNNITQNEVMNIVYNAITGGHLPNDPTGGIYFVLGSADVVGGDGFCSQYCGYHSYYSSSSKKYKYALIINSATQCPHSCTGQYVSSPNDDVGVDGMISVIGHELAEAITDPHMNGWYDNLASGGCENGDKCSWHWGATSTAANGAMYNIVIGGYQYLIQEMFSNVANTCQMAGAVPSTTEAVTTTTTSSSTTTTTTTSSSTSASATSTSTSATSTGQASGISTGASGHLSSAILLAVPAILAFFLVILAL